jgi:hypothetical protein
MAITATFSPGTGVLSLVGGTGRSGGDNDRLIWNLGDGRDVMDGCADIDAAPFDRGIGCDAFTITASAGRVRAFRAFRDQPRDRDQHHQRRRRRRSSK